ncbi:FAD-dependent monooxygenase [Amycolatopsis anabasis]|uniref:FAD-dependent monooxygenase n=1 Tax=Amycolatopsis anabasis TaxID=1840409 RepID=UPI0024840EA0|nr:FAD-dependent monooxygenase [Amycolatopsis anabasis]
MASESERARVAIVGAGIAGLVIATILRRRGVHCELFEQSPVFDAVGAGIQLSPNGVRILHRLGVAPALAENGVQARSIETRRWDDGRLLARVPHGTACDELFGAPYYLIHRADLQRCLVNMLTPGTVHLGRSVARVVERADHVELHFADGGTATAELVIGADGVHSAVRRAVVLDEPKFSGYSVYRGLIPAEVVPSFAADPRVMFWFGPKHHVTYYPISAGKTVHFSAVCATDDERLGSSTTGTETDELAAAFAGWNAEVRRVVTAAASVTRWGLFDRDLADRYVSGRLALVGDAAHPMLPYMSQGANQALEDAVVLTDCLGDGSRDPVRSLRHYEALRKPRTAEVHRQSRIRAESFHFADGVRQQERDFRLAGETLNDLAWLYGYDAALTPAQLEALNGRAALGEHRHEVVS